MIFETAEVVFGCQLQYNERLARYLDENESIVKIDATTGVSVGVLVVKQLAS